jgi:putative GTP pyrophosphokinase
LVDSSALRDWYDELLPLYLRLEEEVRVIVAAALKRSGKGSHSITSRVKGFKSASTKLENRGLLDCNESDAAVFIHLEDMVGVRVVALFRDDLSAISDALIAEFDDCLVEDKIADFETSTTGYQSIHLTACLPHDYRGHRYDGIKGIRFEIQIRTIAMDAWASISHHLNYKTESDVPAEQRRSFRALAGLFYVADTEFQALSDMRQRTIEELTSESETKPEDLLGRPVTADTLSVYMASSPLYTGREKTRGEDVADLAAQLREAGYETLAQVDDAVKRGENSFLEQDGPREVGQKFTDVGRVRVSVAAADPNYEALVYSPRSNA